MKHTNTHIRTHLRLFAIVCVCAILWFTIFTPLAHARSSSEPAQKSGILFLAPMEWNDSSIAYPVFHELLAWFLNTKYEVLALTYPELQSVLEAFDLPGNVHLSLATSFLIARALGAGKIVLIERTSGSGYTFYLYHALPSGNVSERRFHIQETNFPGVLTRIGEFIGQDFRLVKRKERIPSFSLRFSASFLKLLERILTESAPEKRFVTLQRAIAEHPDSPLIRYYQIWTAFERKNVRDVQSLTLSKWLIDKKANLLHMPEWSFALATWYYLHDDYSQALQVLLELTKDYRLPSITYNLALLYRLLDQNKDAFYYIERTRIRVPYDPDVLLFGFHIAMEVASLSKKMDWTSWAWYETFDPGIARAIEEWSKTRPEMEWLHRFSQALTDSLQNVHEEMKTNGVLFGEWKFPIIAGFRQYPLSTVDWNAFFKFLISPERVPQKNWTDWDSFLRWVGVWVLEAVKNHPDEFHEILQATQWFIPQYQFDAFASLVKFVENPCSTSHDVQNLPHSVEHLAQSYSEKICSDMDRHAEKENNHLPSQKKDLK